MRSRGSYRFGDLELAIMNVLWSRGPCTVREVLDHLDVDSQPSYTTVLTMMRLMQGKGYVTRDESARAHVYSARIPERPAKRALVRDLINKVFGGSADALLVRLLEDERVSREDIERAKRAVAKRSRRRG